MEKASAQASTSQVGTITYSSAPVICVERYNTGVTCRFAYTQPRVQPFEADGKRICPWGLWMGLKLHVSDLGVELCEFILRRSSRKSTRMAARSGWVSCSCLL